MKNEAKKDRILLPCGCFIVKPRFGSDVVWCNVHGWSDEWPKKKLEAK